VEDPVGRIAGIKPVPESDGSHVIQVADPSGGQFDVLLSPDEVSRLASALQSTAMLHRAGRAQRLIQLRLLDAVLGFQGEEVALLLSTDQVGTLALHVDEWRLRRLEQEIRDALVFLMNGSSRA